MLIHKLLAFCARRVIERFRPHVIAVTGSIGKTSTRNAIAAALGTSYRVRVAKKNYNNELGVPLAILGEESPGKDIFGWIKIFIRALSCKDMPEYLVLEYGADKPGDLAYLVTIARPEVVVITGVSPVHVANYPNFEALVEEKASLGDAVPDNGLVILNGDDQIVRFMKNRYHVPVQMYGLHNADITVRDIDVSTFSQHADGSFDDGDMLCALQGTVVLPEGEARLTFKDCISSTLFSGVMAAFLVARHYGAELAVVAKALEETMHPVPGRMNPLIGIKGSLILDDSYNAAPASVLAALSTLSAFEPGEEWDRRIAVLGDMAELGDMSDEEHRSIGRVVAKSADLFVAVGPNMNKAAEEAVNVGGMQAGQVEWFATSVEAGRFLDRTVQKGDVVLVKGSQSMRMEKVVRDVMAHPEKATELLVRQEEKWQQT